MIIQDDNFKYKNYYYLLENNYWVLFTNYYTGEKWTFDAEEWRLDECFAKIEEHQDLDRRLKERDEATLFNLIRIIRNA